MSKADQYDQIFMETFNVPKSELDETFTFADREDWDSMSHMNLVSALEDTFEIMLDTEDILNYGSYDNGKKIMLKYGVEV